MDQVRLLNRKINQAYEQAPWRRQLQIIGTFLLVVVTTALVAGIYLNVTARAATIGREIQDMQVRISGDIRLDVTAQEDSSEETTIPIEELRIQIADLEARLAALNAVDLMQERAEKLGFQTVEPDNLVYVAIPGYQGRSEAMLAPPPEPVVVGSPVVPEAYRQSLIDWLKVEAAKSWLLRSPTDLLLKGIQP